jgi:hypothetical protein
VTTITTPGTVISNAKLGCVAIDANNVTITNSDISGSAVASFCVTIGNNLTGVVLSNDTIHGVDAGSNSVEYAIRDYGNDTVIDKANIYNCTECIYSASATVKDSYIHNIATVNGAHYEDIYDGGGSGLTLIHNTILNNQQQTAAVYLAPDFSAVSNVTITDNLLAGGGYTIYGGDGSRPASNIKITNNVFATSFFPNSGQWGPVDDFTVGASGNVWSGNTWQSGGSVAS